MSRLRICFTPNAWEEYTAWSVEDRAMIKRIHPLIEAVGRAGSTRNTDSSTGSMDRR